MEISASVATDIHIRNTPTHRDLATGLDAPWILVQQAWRSRIPLVPISGISNHGSTRPQPYLALFSELARCVSCGGLYAIHNPRGWVSVLLLCLA